MSVLGRIPVVAGLVYVERLRRQPASFVVKPRGGEPDNRYFPDAIAVIAAGEKVGYVAPEVARRYVETIGAGDGATTCPARRAGAADHGTSGVELLLDFSALPEP